MIAAQKPKQTKISIYRKKTQRRRKKINRTERRKVHEIGEDELVKIIKRRPDTWYGERTTPAFFKM